MTEIHTFAILYAAEGKAERMRSLLEKQCKKVHENEDYTLRFLVTEPIAVDSKNASVAEQRDDKGEEFVMFETYKSKEAMLQHEEESYFKEGFGLFVEEGLMAKAPLLIRTVSKAGFDRDRKLI
ncbi:hypothetical protein B0A54_00781 [Friedmanniomyces endolithicus]|uniref:ABM domain-containing protein n=1 Tax=Friedmanniomyces endolithicus TaxID=329885 RepID=A0A4U0VJW0_9PEZI|nr:hypothetical protein B0A54_00781 [Friedmanniomyces endolithicus]